MWFSLGDGDGDEGRGRGGLPDDSVATDDGESGVPAMDGTGEVEGGDDADGAQRIPLLQEGVAGS